jgi:hypothetical protein
MIRLIARTLSSCCALVFLLIVVGGPAYAARGAKPASEPFDPEDIAVKEGYRKAIAEGVAEYDAGRFEEALVCFRRAHQLSPNARTFRGIGKAAFELRDYVLAVRNLTAALSDSRKPLSEDQREEAQDLLDRGRLFVAIYTLKVSPSEAQVLLDGNTAELQPDGSLMVGLGAHTLEARAKGYQRRTLSLKVRGGERKPLSLTLDPQAPPTVQAPAAKAPGLVGLAASEPVKPSHRKAVKWFVGSGASALLAVGAGVYWGIQASNLNKCRHPSSGPTCTNEKDLIYQRNAGATVTIVAGAAAVTMATLGILSWKSAPPAEKLSLSCAVGPFGVTCGGAF